MRLHKIRVEKISLFRLKKCAVNYFWLLPTEALKGHRQRNNYIQCWLKILDKMRNIRSSWDKYVKIT